MDSKILHNYINQIECCGYKVFTNTEFSNLKEVVGKLQQEKEEIIKI